jgi:hypothetical protein
MLMTILDVGDIHCFLEHLMDTRYHFGDIP